MELKLLNIDLNVAPSEESKGNDNGDLQVKNLLNNFGGHHEDINIHVEDNMHNNDITCPLEVLQNVNTDMPNIYGTAQVIMNYDMLSGGQWKMAPTNFPAMNWPEYGLQNHGEESSIANSYAYIPYWMPVPGMVVPNTVMGNGSAYVNKNCWGYVYHPLPPPPQTLMPMFSINNNNNMSGSISYSQSTPPIPLIGNTTSSSSSAPPPATAAAVPPMEAKKKRRPATHGGRTCALCRATSTKMWRRGTLQEPLCNKCGLRIGRAAKKALGILPKKRAVKTPNTSLKLC